jgi:hypothetical protein
MNAPGGVPPVGTRIRFLKTLEEAPNEAHPWVMFACAGERGIITGHGTKEGYWARTDSWPAPFGLAPDEFEVLP